MDHLLAQPPPDLSPFFSKGVISPEINLLIKKLVWNEARKRQGLYTHLHLDDLFQAGYTRILRNTNQWKPEGGKTVHMFCLEAARQGIQRHTRKFERLIKPADHFLTKTMQVSREMNAARNRTGEKYPLDEVSCRMGMSESQLGEMLHHTAVITTTSSFDERIFRKHDDNSIETLHDLTPDPNALTAEELTHFRRQHETLVSAIHFGFNSYREESGSHDVERDILCLRVTKGVNYKGFSTTLE